MNQMLSAIKNLQVIVHLGLFGIALPGVASMFFKSIQTWIAFDPIPNTDAYIEDLFQIEEDEDAEIDVNFT